MFDPGVEKEVLQQLIDEMYSMDADGAMKKKKKGKYADVPMISIEIETKGKGPGPGPMAGPMAMVDGSDEPSTMEMEEPDDEEDMMEEEAGIMGIREPGRMDPRLLRKLMEKMRSA